MKKLVLLFALIFTLSLIGCSSGSSIVSPDVDYGINQAPGTPVVDTLGNTNGDPGSAGDGYGKVVPGDPIDGNDGQEGDPDSMGDGLSNP